MARFEYRGIRQEYLPSDDLLNEMGADGWELVQVIPAWGVAAKYDLYFKRKVKP